MSILNNVEPSLLWKYFDALSKIPRASGNETAAAEFVISVANDLRLEHKKDSVGNVLILKPATPGHENAPIIVMQSHLDMVCEKNSDKVFDFDTEAIQLLREGDWLTADGTTLGADNGIGVATMLAIFEDDSITHGALEGLFTVDEERGLNGAMSVSQEWLQGRTMLNLDSEEIGVFSIGCAGGRDTNLSLNVERTTANGDTTLKIHLAGLRGGHSGIDIHEGRGNAVKILNQLLYCLRKTESFQLASFWGGDKHNAIPREAFAEIIIESSQKSAIQKSINSFVSELKIEYNPVETNIQINMEDIAQTTTLPITDNDLTKLLALAAALPHGVSSMSRAITSLVETSNNVAALRCEENAFKFLTSSRSSNMSSLQELLDVIVNIAELAGADVEQPPGYPGWMPDLDSKVLNVALDTYKQVAGEDAKYEAIHAGLECGLIGEKFPGMDMISVGPTLQHPHSPDERVHIGTVKLFYDHVLKMLEAMA
jgi:dipeptidase D